MAAQGHAPGMRVVIVTSADELDQPWIGALQADSRVDVRTLVGVVAHGIEAVQRERPDVLLIDRPLDQAEQVLQAVTHAAPQTACIALLARQDMAAVRRLAAAGAHDLLLKPVAQTALLASMRQVMQRERTRRRDDQTAASAQPAAPSGGSAILVLGSKGGVGTTTIATNLAVALRRVTDRPVALADFSPQFGDLGVLLNLWSRQTLYDLTQQPGPINDALLDQTLVLHKSGVDVLLAPDEPGLRAGLSDAQVTMVVQALRARYAYIVIDGGSLLDPVCAMLLRLVDRVLVVATPEVPALKNARQTLDYLADQGLLDEQVSLVINRFPSIKGIKLHDIQQHVGHPVRANLPSDGQAVTYAVNTGVPVLESYPQSWIAQSLLRLAAALVGDPIETIADAPARSTARLPHSRARLLRWRLRLGLRKPTEQASRS